VRRHNDVDTVRIGLFNSRCVTGKSANIQQWIAVNKLSIAALTETWHDDAASPDLIACAPAGFKFVEKARARTNELSILTNHGSVCLFHNSTLRARDIELASDVRYVRGGCCLRTPCRVQCSCRRRLQTRIRQYHSELLRRIRQSARAIIDILSAGGDRRHDHCSMSGLRRTATVIHSTC